jgi:GNAT superfamily N-acetyltransferase
MEYTIREFTPEDYDAITEISNAVYSEYPTTVEEIRFSDEKRDPKCFFKRFVLEHAGRVVGMASYGHFTWLYHPKKFFIGVDVHPEYQGRGFGSALYKTIEEDSRPHDPLRFLTQTREDWSRGVRFLFDRGFEEASRAWESRLDVHAFDFTPYADAWDKLQSEHGIVIRTFQELEHDPERNRKVYDLDWETSQDMPMTEPLTQLDYDYYWQRTLENPCFLPDALFIAVHGEDYVGMSALWSSLGNDDLYTGLTGVKRTYRGKGVAFALKLRAIDYARKRGNPLIKTWNDTTNRAMLGINERLGFVKQPAWLEVKKDLREPREGEAT